MPDTPATPEAAPKEKKKKRNKQDRIFRISDAEFLMRSRVKQRHFTDHIADFINFDIDFAPPFADTWLAKIEAAEGNTPDYSALAVVGQQTDQLKAAIVALIKKLNHLEYFAYMAFKEDKEVLYEFGFNKVNRPDQYNYSFITNSTVIRMLAETDYNAELLAAGMPPALITELDALITAAAQAEALQEKQKRTRLKETRLRIKALNEIYAINQLVSGAAGVVFHQKPETRQLFGMEVFF